MNALEMNPSKAKGELGLSGTHEGAMAGWVTRRGGSTSFKAEHASNYAHAASADADASGDKDDHHSAALLHAHAQHRHEVAAKHATGRMKEYHQAQAKMHADKTWEHAQKAGR